jgi:hypothetical protein
VNTDADQDIDEQYEIFHEFLDRSTPAEAIKKFRRISADEDLVRRIVERHERETIELRKLEDPPSVYRNNRVTWYAGPRAGDPNWEGLMATLRAKNWAPESLQSLDEASDRVVGLLDHPKQSEFSSLGLVVGYVQSGKTTNFTAVMAKAADRGYKLFVVLSGIHNALRRQTQIRLEKDLLGGGSSPRWFEVTTPDHDFVPPRNPKAFFANKDQHVLLVVKKNATVLRKLRTWLAGAGEFLEQCPTLIIDDEADQSTIATKKITPLLHDVFSKFTQVGYIGYTATPFANLLSNPHDPQGFYPRDFIVNLPQPFGHQGTEVLFGREPHDWEDPEEAPGGYDMIRRVFDGEVGDLKPANRRESATFSPSVTPSLEAALRWFWLATAAKRVRGLAEAHSTMLVHTTVESAVHFAFVGPVEGVRKNLRIAVEGNDSAVVAGLRATWEEETSKVRANTLGETPVSFDEVLPHLLPVLDDTRVVVDNYRSKDRLDYDSGPVVAIAIGGNTLSRGLTLEGLVCSLFVRAASAYDTLLQMGRWFGYRQGYADLPRIWMTAELEGWFRHLATVEAQMRLDIDRYMTEDTDPMRFAVRLLSHPKMLITAKAKMKDARVATAAYGGELVETRYFKVGENDHGWLENNRDAAHRLVERSTRRGARDPGVTGQRVLFTGVPQEVVREFLLSYEFHERSVDGERRRLLSYVDRRLRVGSLLEWDVAVIGNVRTDAREYTLAPDVTVRMPRRGRLDPAKVPLASGEPADIKTLTGPRDETVDLDLSTATDSKRTTFNRLRRRQRDGVGLLMLYPLDPTAVPTAEGRSAIGATIDVVMGVALVFPEPGDDDLTEYEYYSAAITETIEQDDPDALEAPEDDA